jgi:hypothetical protein
LNTGHAGSLATIHRTPAEKALHRFASLVLRNHAQTSFTDTEAEIGEAADFVVHVSSVTQDGASSAKCSQAVLVEQPGCMLSLLDRVKGWYVISGLRGMRERYAGTARSRIHAAVSAGISIERWIIALR